MLKSWLTKVLLFTGLTLLLYWICPYNSSTVELVYYNGIFRFFRTIWDHTLGFSPIPLIYLLLTLVIFIMVRRSRTFLLQEKSKKKRLVFFSKGMILFVAYLVSAFYWLWGFNYKRPNPFDINEIAVSQPGKDDLFDELKGVTAAMEELRSSIQSDDLSIATGSVPESKLRLDLTRALRSAGFNPVGRVRARLLYPKGSLLHFSTAGIYLPFVGEGHIDPGLHEITWPFTIVHEMSHGYGFTGEDICNFWALLACVNSTNKAVQYSGYFTYWRYLISNARRADPERFKTYWESVSPEIKEDLRAVLSYSNRYPDILPKLRDLVYDNYLKSHGIEEGLLSYSRIIVLAHSWKAHHGTLTLP